MIHVDFFDCTQQNKKCGKALLSVNQLKLATRVVSYNSAKEISLLTIGIVGIQ